MENKETKAPKVLHLKTDGWGDIQAMPKDFSSGSTGFYANGKIVNPESGARYQVSCSIVLIGSKPEAKKK